MLVGIHSEGWDYLILKALLAKTLSIPEQDMEVDPAGPPDSASGRGWSYILMNIPVALRRFYHKSAKLALIGVDNDGNRDCLRENLPEDPDRPRHWNHEQAIEKCRWCQINQKVHRVRSNLWEHHELNKDKWPIIISVPVEQIESWLLTIQAIMQQGTGSLNAENELRTNQKTRFYGTDRPMKEDIEKDALTMIRGLNEKKINLLKQHSKSFANFADQINRARETILKLN